MQPIISFKECGAHEKAILFECAAGRSTHFRWRWSVRLACPPWRLVDPAKIGGDLDNLSVGAAWVFATPPPAGFQVRYASNLNVGDSVVNLTNTGVVSGFDPDGRICVARRLH